MPMTSSDVPHLRGSAMADTRTAAEKAAAEREQKAADDREAEQKAAAEKADKAERDKLAADKAAAEKAVREAKTPAEKATAERALEQAKEREAAHKERKATRSGPLGRAGESGDPDVQRLLAQREAHVMNSQPDPSFAAQREDAVKAIKDIDDKLAELGFTAE